MQFKRYRDIAIVLLALAVPFWFLRASMRDPKQTSGADKVIVRIASPVQYAAATLARGVSNIWGDYIYLVDVKEDNAALQSQNARLKERVRKLETLEEENRRLRRLLDMKASSRSDAISAQVIGKSTNDFFRVVRVTLDKGKEIDANWSVLAADGVVGTTLKSAGDTVDVRLIVDAGAAVDAVVQRTGARAFVRGSGDDTKYLCKVEYVQRTDEVEIGDLLVTSGVGRRFPKNIPIGVVTQVVKRDFGIYQEVVAAPVVDFSRLEEVIIIPPGALADETTASKDAPAGAPKK
jgi:rod shape-determining protein MreC